MKHHTVTLDRDRRAQLKGVAVAASKDSTLPILHGVGVWLTENGVEFGATDRFIITLTETNVAKKPDYLISQDVVKAVTKGHVSHVNSLKFDREDMTVTAYVNNGEVATYPVEDGASYPSVVPLFNGEVNDADFGETLGMNAHVIDKLARTAKALTNAKVTVRAVKNKRMADVTFMGRGAYLHSRIVQQSH